MKGVPKVQNFVKNGQQAESKPSQPLFQNVQVMSKGQTNSQLQSGYIQISQMGGQSETGSQITQKKKMQSL